MHKTVSLFTMPVCLLLLGVSSLQAQLSVSYSKVSDSVTIPASTKYENTTFLRRLIMGTNYRKEWATPVTLPVFRLKESGFTIEELGGGMQTKSLRLQGKDKREWVLRSVDKDAAGAVPKVLQNTLAEKVVQDMISAAHPYGALTVGYLARAAGVVAPRPKLYFIPDDPAFGKYRNIFAQTVCFLEQREPTPDRSETDNTEDVYEKIVEENDHLILQRMVLRARLLDMLVADWDRHDDQWRWGTVDSGTFKFYYAIPRDRDQAFFMSNGLLPRLVKPFAMRYINSFKKESTGLKNLSFKSWQFDKTFMNELDASMWEKIIKEFQRRLSDKVIIASVKNMPPEIFALDSALLVGKLISRRNTLLPNAMKYYRFLSGLVQVNGSEEEERFQVSGNKDSITVTVHRYKKDKSPGQKIYERTFFPHETGQIYLAGLEGDDTFIIDKHVSSTIKIKIYGGEGKDTFDVNGNVRNTIYDTKSEKNVIVNKSRSRVCM